MSKKLVSGFIALAIMIGGGAAIMSTSNETHACEECDTSNLNRKCKCGSSRLFAKKEEYVKGELRTYWKCEDCSHSFVTARRKGKEVVLQKHEL